MIEQSSVTQYTEDQRDCLQEICNVATGQTADVLARQLDDFVTLPIPEIKIIDAGKLAYSLTSFEAQASVYCASQRFSGSEGDSLINGQALVLLSEHCLNALKSSSLNQNSLDAVAENICHPMATACLKALSDQWELELQSDEPQFVGVKTVADVCAMQTKGWRKVLLVEIHYRLEKGDFEGDLLLLFPDQAIITMAQKLDELLDY
jgi:chemotaxis protein CheC